MPTMTASGTLALLALPPSALRLLAVVGLWLLVLSRPAEAVVPVVVGPLQALLALLPSILLALGGMLLALFRPSGVKKLVRFLWAQKAFTAVLVGVVVGVVALAHGSRSGPAAGEARGGSDWSAFRGGARRTGAVPGSPDPTTDEPVWTFDREAKTFLASPAVVGNRLYVSVADKGVFSDRGAVLCLDAETGAEAWRYAPPGFRATFSSPAVAEGCVVVGEGLHDTTDARVTCLDLAGRLRWELRTKSHVETSPCIAEGRVYVGAGDDGLYCIELKPGPGGQPQVAWHLEGERYRDCESGPIVHEGVVYFGLGEEGNALCAVAADTGRELWRLATPYPVFAPPTVADGKLIVGMGNGNFVDTAEQVKAKVLAAMREAGKPAEEIAAAEKRLGPAGEVWCVDLQTRQVEWRFALPETVLGAVAAGANRLFFGSRDGHFYCLSTAGKLVRQWNARGAILTSAAVGAGHVYLVTASGRLCCLTADALEPVWEASLGAGGNFLSSPAVALGYVYVGTDGRGLRCIGRTGEPPPPLWADGQRGGADRSPLAARGALAWKYPQEESEGLAVTAPLMPLGDALYVPCLRARKPTLLKLRLGDAQEGDRAEWAVPLPRPVRVAPAGSGDAVFVVDGIPGEEGRAVRCLAAADGAERWRFPLEPGASGQFTLDHRHLFGWIGPETVACLPHGGHGAPKPRWEARLGPGVFPPAPQEGIVVVATTSELIALDDESGTVLWRVSLTGAPLFGPLRLHQAVLLAAGNQLTLRSILDGSLVWSVAPGRVTAPPVADAERVAVVTEKGEVVLLSAADGKELSRIPDAVPGVPLLLASETVLFPGRNLMALLPGADEPVLWARTSGLGPAQTPIVWFQSHAYFATEKRGIACVGPRP
jgi:outer membrane protein assembly factor BamB